MSSLSAAVSPADADSAMGDSVFEQRVPREVMNELREHHRRAIEAVASMPKSLQERARLANLSALAGV